LTHRHSLRFAGVILFESTTFSSLPQPTLPGVKNYESTGPDDDLILELAVAASCRYIVTHNLRDFHGTQKWGVTAVTPAAFLKLTTPKP